MARYEPVSLEQMYMTEKIESLEDPAVQKQLDKGKRILQEMGENDVSMAVKREHPLKDFDLRKAVIFSEILRRPYD